MSFFAILFCLFVFFNHTYCFFTAYLILILIFRLILFCFKHFYSALKLFNFLEKNLVICFLAFNKATKTFFLSKLIFLRISNGIWFGDMWILIIWMKFFRNFFCIWFNRFLNILIWMILNKLDYVLLIILFVNCIKL